MFELLAWIIEHMAPLYAAVRTLNQLVMASKNIRVRSRIVQIICWALSLVQPCSSELYSED